MGRTMQGMSQESVGEAIGVTFQQIQKYERGVNCIRAGKLWDLAKALKVPVTFFYDGFSDGNYSTDAQTYAGAADAGNSGFTIEDLAGSRESIELMRAFNRVSDAKLRSKIVDLVRSMADNKSLMGE